MFNFRNVSFKSETSNWGLQSLPKRNSFTWPNLSKVRWLTFQCVIRIPFLYSPRSKLLCRISSTESLEEADSLKGPVSKQTSSSDSVKGKLESFDEYSRLPLSIGPGFVETLFDNSNESVVWVKFNSWTVMINFLQVTITDKLADLHPNKKTWYNSDQKWF